MSYGYFDGENTLLTGSAKQLDDLVEDDVFRASVTVLGKIDYDTQIGGNTTVPLLEGQQHQGHRIAALGFKRVRSFVCTGFPTSSFRGGRFALHRSPLRKLIPGP